MNASDLIEKAHDRAVVNQDRTRRRINSSLSALFGGGFVATVAAASLDALPWWAMVLIAVVLAVAEVLSQAFSRASLAPSQRHALVSAAEEIEAEHNPAAGQLPVFQGMSSQGLG